MYLPPSEEGGGKAAGFDGGRERSILTTPQPTAVGSSPDKGSQGGMFHVKHFAPSPRLCRALNTPRILNCVGLRVSHGDFSNRTRSALLRRALNTPRMAVEHLYHAFRLQLCLKDEISPGNVSFYPCFVTRQTLNRVFTSIIIRMVSVNKIDIIKLTGGFSWKDDAQAIRPGPLFC